MGNSSRSSRQYTVNDVGVENVRKIMIHDNPNHNIYLYKIYYNYKAIGSHRFLELLFYCRNCSFSKYVRMDKTSDGSKNINYFNEPFKDKGWWWWKYIPKNTVTFEDCIRLFNNAPTGYNLARNNCADFAKYIWKRID